MKKIVLVYLFFFIGVYGIAQDFQFSQLEANQALNIPAAFALNEANGQIDLAYRSLNVEMTPFRTMLFSYQHKVNDFTFGTRVIQNDAGAASLKRSKIILNFTYKKVLNEAGDAIVFGAGGGVLQQRFQESLIEFDNQYVTGQGFSSAISNGESFSLTNQIVPVLNVSLLGKKHFERLSTNFGFTLNHINQSSLGFYDFKKEPVRVGVSAFGLATLPWGEKSIASLYVFHNRLEVDSEQLVGLKLKRLFSPNYAMHVGLGKRIGAAFIAEAGISIRTIEVSMSYDFDTAFDSMLDSYKGVVELRVSYKIRK